MSRKVLLVIVVFVFIFSTFISACVVQNSVELTPNLVKSEPVIENPEIILPDVTEMLTLTPNVVIIPGFTSTPTALLLKERLPVTLDMVRNLAPAVPLKLDANGNIEGMSSEVSQKWSDSLKSCYKAVRSKYPTSEVYLDVDIASNSYVIIIIMGGALFYQTFENQDGGYVYSEFPTSFEDGDSGHVLSGEYKPIKIPNTSIGVVWVSGIPQLLSNYVELPDGETFFTHYMDYSEIWSYNAFPWKEVLGVKEVMASFPAIEMNLEPIYEQNTEYEYMGVKINAGIILDKSSYPGMVKLNIPDSVFAEFIARIFFGVWWDRQKPNYEPPTEYDFVNFMKSWSQAQLSNDVQSWKKIQIEDIWANNLSDGFVYQQKPYDILLMCDEDVTEDFTPINKVSIVYTGYGNNNNVTPISTSIDIMYEGQGTNIAGRTLFIYYYRNRSTEVTLDKWFLSEIISEQLAFMGGYLTTNKGESIADRLSGSYDRYLYGLLLYGGLRAE